jgi:hypothetical protein
MVLAFLGLKQLLLEFSAATCNALVLASTVFCNFYLLARYLAKRALALAWAVS